MTEKLEFKPRARLLLQLGDQLIRSESIAILEIVKNAYDADASVATVEMKNLQNPEKSQIIITDDGDGMNERIIKDIWMQPGSEHKEKLISEKAIEEGKRIPIGGKGIGRFGVHKLGSKIELVSKMNGFNEVKVKIDWRDFEADKPLSKVKISFTENSNPTHFKEKRTGTKIIIDDLKSAWTRGTVRDLYRAIMSLNSPFESKGSFKTLLKVDPREWTEGLLKFRDIRNHALYYSEAVIEGDSITSIDYKFTPWDTMSKLPSREDNRSNVPMVQKIRDSSTGKMKTIPLDLTDQGVGKITLKLLIFDRSPKILSLGMSDKKGFSEYLNANGGIRVFRNGIRVYDYGEPDNDWLNLDLRRINQPGKAISNNLIIGAIYLNRETSEGLIEKTNREGFIENSSYTSFVGAVGNALDKILTQRNIDKELVQKFYNAKSTSQPVLGRLQDLRGNINEKVQDVELKEELLNALFSIEKDFEEISEIYMRSSSAGLSLSIVMHEIIHMIAELAAALKDRPNDHIKQLVRSLQKTVGDYAGVIKQSNKTKGDLVKITRQSLSNIQFRIKAHDIQIINMFEERGDINTSISCAQNLVTSTIINVVDNSLWWQEYARIKNKKLFIDIVEYPENHVSLLIADNGPGFSIPPDEAIKPFISDKPGGMGLGLHLADEVMKGQKGRLIFPDTHDFELPQEFESGAKLLLAFRRML
jgi:signal transduction histidine kinase